MALLVSGASGLSGVCRSPSPYVEASVTTTSQSASVPGARRNQNFSPSLTWVAMKRKRVCYVASLDEQLQPGFRTRKGFQFTKVINASWSSDSKTSISCQALVDDHNDVSTETFTAQAHELFEGEASFFTRLALAWNILFPSKRNKQSSIADIAKHRLKMILISDRCSVNDEAKRRIVNNIVGALSAFVEIESQDEVQLTVSSDPALGTVYSVTVPIRRVKPEFQEYSREVQNVALTEEFVNELRTPDIKLEYPGTVDEQE